MIHLFPKEPGSASHSVLRRMVPLRCKNDMPPLLAIIAGRGG